MAVDERHSTRAGSTASILQATLRAAPGVNATYRTARSGHWYLSNRAQQWEQDAMLALRAAGFRTQPDGCYWIGVEMSLYTIALDVDAPIKLVLDTIEGALGVDDRWTGRLTVSKVVVAHRADERLEVQVSVQPVRNRDAWRELSEQRLQGGGPV